MVVVNFRVHLCAQLLDPEAKELAHRLSDQGVPASALAHDISGRIANKGGPAIDVDKDDVGGFQPFAYGKQAKAIHEVLSAWLAEPDNELDDEALLRLRALLEATAPMRDD